jgi:hypothetical protein
VGTGAWGRRSAQPRIVRASTAGTGASRRPRLTGIVTTSALVRWRSARSTSSKVAARARPPHPYPPLPRPGLGWDSASPPYVALSLVGPKSHSRDCEFGRRRHRPRKAKIGGRGAEGRGTHRSRGGRSRSRRAARRRGARGACCRAARWGAPRRWSPRQGLTLFHFRAQLEDLRDTSLKLQINPSTFGTHPRVDLNHMGDKVSLS